MQPTDGAHDEAAGANDDLWHLDKVGLSNEEERFDEGLDEGFDEGSCDEGFNGKWFDRPEDARMVGGGEAAVEIWPQCQEVCQKVVALSPHPSSH